MTENRHKFLHIKMLILNPTDSQHIENNQEGREQLDHNQDQNHITCIYGLGRKTDRHQYTSTFSCLMAFNIIFDDNHMHLSQFKSLANNFTGHFNEMKVTCYSSILGTLKKLFDSTVVLVCILCSYISFIDSYRHLNLQFKQVHLL